MSSEKILEKIREILTENCTKEYTRPITVNRLKPKDFERHQQDRIKAAEELADHIYNLSNLERVIAPEAYKSVFQRNLAGRTSEDNQFILKHAQKYFREHFGETIKKNGESPELIEQIVKRTGINTRADFEAVIAGFNAPSLAQAFYKIDINEEKQLIAFKSSLERLNPEQLMELQAEIKIIPIREIAEVAMRYLDPNKADLQSLQLLLQTKSPVEIEKVVKVIEETYILKEGQEPTSMQKWLEKNFAGSELRIIKRILEGLSLEKTADDIAWIFLNANYLWIDFAGLQTQKLGKLVLHVEHNQPQTFNIKQELHLRPFIHSIIYFLNNDQFEELNDIFTAKFNYRLHKILYFETNDSPLTSYLKLEKALSELGNLDPLQVCFSDYRRTFYSLTKQDFSFDNNQIYNLVLARLLFIYNLPTKALSALNETCQANTKLPLYEAIRKRITNLDVKNNFDNLIQLLASGLGQKPVYLDLNEHIDQILAKHSLPIRLKYLADVEKRLIGQIDNFSITPEEKAVLIINELQKLNHQQLIDIDQLFYYKNESSLLLKIKPLLSPAACLKIKVILAGFNPKEEAKNLIAKYSWQNLIYLSPLEIALLDTELKKSHQTNLLDFLEKQSHEELPQEVILAPAFYPLVSQFKQKILEPKAWGKLETDYVLNHFTSAPTRLKALEIAYDFIFNYLESSEEATYGSWRNSFIIQAQLNNLEKGDYTKLISLAEDIPITLIPEIFNLTIESPRMIEELHQLDLIMRTHRRNLKIIKMLYLIYDGELSLRERIYKFKVLPRDENLSLLLLDGYDPEKLAKEMIAEFKAPNKLSVNHIYEKLNPESSTLIPVKENWKHEMYHQLRIRYEIFSGRKLVSDILKLVKNQEELPIVRKICDLLYGEMSTKCFAIHQALQSKNADPKLIVKKLEHFKPSQVEQMDHLYYSYFGLSLLQKLVDFFPDDNDDRFAEALFKKSQEWEEEKLKLKLEQN